MGNLKKKAVKQAHKKVASTVKKHLNRIKAELDHKLRRPIEILPKGHDLVHGWLRKVKADLAKARHAVASINTKEISTKYATNHVGKPITPEQEAAAAAVHKERTAKVQRKKDRAARHAARAAARA